MRTVMYISSAIFVWNNSGCSSMGKALDYRSKGGAACGFEPTGRRFPDHFQQFFSSQFYAKAK